MFYPKMTQRTGLHTPSPVDLIRPNRYYISVPDTRHNKQQSKDLPCEDGPCDSNDICIEDMSSTVIYVLVQKLQSSKTQQLTISGHLTDACARRRHVNMQ